MSSTIPNPDGTQLIRCPVLQSCDQVMDVTEVADHCSNYHPKVTFRDTFASNLEFGNTCAAVLIKNDIPFLIFLFLYSDQFRYYVVSLDPRFDSLKFNLKILKDNELVFNDNCPIPLFDEVDHCTRCFANSKSECHRGYGKLDRIWKLLCLPYIVFKQLNSNRSFRCVINILDDRIDLVNNDLITRPYVCPGCFNPMKAEIFFCSSGHPICKSCKTEDNTCDCGETYLEVTNHMAEDLRDTLLTQPNIEELNSEIYKFIECPICREAMTKKICICPSGHSICETCRRKMSECPFTRQLMEYDIRNFLIEELTSTLHVPCQNAGSGCNFTDKMWHLEAHHKYCRVRENHDHNIEDYGSEIKTT